MVLKHLVFKILSLWGATNQKKARQEGDFKGRRAKRVHFSLWMNCGSALMLNVRYTHYQNWLECWRRCLFWRGRCAERALKNIPADPRNPWSYENLRNLKYVWLLESLLLVLKNSLFWHADNNSPCSACEELRELNIMDLIKETTEFQATFSSDVLVVTLRLSYSMFFL